MSWRRRLGGGLLLVALTIVLGPLLFAAGTGLFAGTGEADRALRPVALLEAYRDHWPPELSSPSRDFGAAIRNCGYEEAALFPPGEARAPGSDEPWNPYGGYFDLLIERSRDWDRRLDELRWKRLDSQTSAFSAEFLRICMRQSLFASVCAGRVRAILEAGDLDTDSDAWPQGVPRPDQSRNDRNICVYLDGIAARRGVPLAARSDARPAR
jgi:hypothetical protein